MDNLTHSLVGLAAAKAGLEKLSPGATVVCILAANGPDIDVAVALFTDRWGVLKHHRGITHSILGTLVLAVLLPTIFYLVDIFISRIKSRPVQVKFRSLLIVSLLVSATHPFLDWTNNYGIRFLLPWSSRWFYGDFVFIVDPYIWLILGSACFLLTAKTRFQRVVWLILGLVVTLLVMLSPRAGNFPYPWLIRGFWIAALACLAALFAKNVGERVGSKIAIASLVSLVVYWGALSIVHYRALAVAGQQAASISGSNEFVTRLAVMPTLANPFGWDCVFETDQATYRFRLDLFGASPVTRTVRYNKPSGSLAEALQAVSSDRRSEIFLGFARFPVAKLADESCATQTLVQLADLRYTEPGTSRGNFSLELPVDCPHVITVNR